ncbi:LysR family transcriptional regulator [Roseobacter sp. EG26]|uniref:LysR family transcriptional regulator n=1 Tax=Roseobacter sp. EG26 TaxID=3412477 RepID=UPI003CE5A942
MDLQWLDDVLVLLEEGNMTRAAARRNITQPAFSRRIRGFENWLGTQVLTRAANSVEISPALGANEAEIRALIGRIRDLRGKIAHFDPASSTVSLAAQHASVISTYPDMALHAKRHFPSLKFRLRPGNLGDCVTMFLRGDAHILLCYEADNAAPLPFAGTIRRAFWGHDYLVPLVGGGLRYAVRDDGSLPVDAPAIVYPESSYFGEVLNASERPFGTQTFSNNAVCETAFSSGIKELVLNGMGVGWLPFSMSHKEIESGELISLANHMGRERLKIVLYADMQEQIAMSLLDIWSADRR